MITSFVLNAFFNILWIVLAPIRNLPDASLPEGLTTALENIGSYVVPLDRILPVASLTAILGLFVVIEGGIIVWGIINWILRRIPTQS
jgi:hypothetical protein